MATQYGLTPLGFVVKQQQTIIAELNASFQAVFGANINLGAESVFGQIIGIFSEREALIWQLADAVYASQYPSGAEGMSVDNILALNNLKRLPALPTVTAADSVTDVEFITLYGAVVYGTPGTVVTVDSLVQTGATPPVQFQIDATVTIPSPLSAVQSLFMSTIPTSGAFALSLTEGPFLMGNVFTDLIGEVLTTQSIPFNSLPNQTQLSFSTTPASTTHFGLTLTRAGAALTTANIATNAAYPTALAIQNAIQALAGYSGVTVSGSAGSYTITWGAIANPLVTVANNTTTVTITPLDSIQATINNLLNPDVPRYPYTDVTVTGTISNLIFSFGGLAAPISPQATSANQPQPIMAQAANTLMASSTVVNLNIVNTTIGQGTGVPNVGVIPVDATCTQTGPNFVAAGTLTSIASPITGWLGVYNELDCTTGANAESDTTALIRRSTLLAAQANGPLQSIVEKVLKVPGVTASKGFQNITCAAQQTITFASLPGSGHYGIQINGQVTANIAFGASSADVQSAIRLLSGFSVVLVTGTAAAGFVIDFNNANGGQAVPLGTIVNNTTGVVGTIAFGRPPKSFEIVVEGGADADIAKVIYSAMPAGIQSYGTTTVVISDAFNNPIDISFSRPTAVPIYVTIVLITDQYIVPGNSASGVNLNAKFNPQSVSTIQDDLITIGNQVAIGGLIIGFGTNGLVGAFNSVPGIVSYTLAFGTAPTPTLNTNIQMQAEQVPVFETFNIIVSYT